jgi:hypothetical protein
MSPASLLLACGIITAMLATAAGIVRALIWAWRFTTKMVHLADSLLGEPAGPGIPEGRPGILDRLAGIETAVGQVVPRLDGLDARLTALESQTDLHR